MSVEILIDGNNQDFSVEIQDSVAQLDVKPSDNIVEFNVDAAPTVIEMPIIPETPVVSFSQELYVHIPLASFTEVGISSFNSEHFDIVDNNVRLNTSTLERFKNIVSVDALPTTNISEELMYIVGEKCYVYTNGKWLQINEVVTVVDNTSDVTNRNKLYYVTDTLLTGYYLLYNDKPQRIVFADEFNELHDKVDEVDELANQAVSLANKAIVDAEDSAKLANSAIELSESANTTALESLELATQSMSKSITAIETSNDALRRINSITSVFKPKGNKTASELSTLQPSADTVGFVYNITDEFTTDDRFVEGPGILYPANTNIVVVEIDNKYLYDVFSGVVDFSPINERLTILEDAIAKLSYTDIAINSLSVLPSTAKKGSTVTATISWKLSKEPKSVILQIGPSNSIDVLSNTTKNSDGTFSGNHIDIGVSSNKTYTLKVTGSRNEYKTSSRTLQFNNSVYYGAATEPESYTSDFLDNLNENHTNSDSIDTTANVVGDNVYFYYCTYDSSESPKFWLGSEFQGGMGKLSNTIIKDNLTYHIYKSDYPDLGNLKITIQRRQYG